MVIRLGGLCLHLNLAIPRDFQIGLLPRILIEVKFSRSAESYGVRPFGRGKWCLAIWPRVIKLDGLAESNGVRLFGREQLSSMIRPRVTKFGRSAEGDVSSAVQPRLVKFDHSAEINGLRPFGRGKC